MNKISTADMEREATQAATFNAKCWRCGKDPALSHDNAYCPAFGSTKEVGRWIPFSNILHAVRKEIPNVEVRHSCRTEEQEGPAGEWSNVVGLYRDGEYIGRFDTPAMPEFGLWAARRGQHSMLRKGWRIALRDIATKTNVRFERFARHLGVNPDRTTEEITRFKLGFL